MSVVVAVGRVGTLVDWEGDVEDWDERLMAGEYWARIDEGLS